MGLRDLFKGWGAKMHQRLYVSSVGEPPKRGTREFLETYQASPVVNAVASRVGQSVGATKWELRGLRDEILTDHVMLRVLQAPNPHMTGADFFRLLQVQLDMVGEVFVIKERNGLGAPIGLYPIPAHWVAETPTANEPNFRLSWKSLNERIPASEVWWAKIHAPADPYGRGAGIAQALSDEIATFEYSSKHAQGIFFNRAMPEIVIQDEGASADEVTRHEEHWNSRLQGFWRAFKPYFTNRKLEFWQPNQMNLENLTLVPLQKFERDMILMTWGVGAEQLGVSEGARLFKNIQADAYVYETQVIRPRRQWWALQLQTYIAPEYDKRIRVGFADTTPEDAEQKLNALKAAPHSVTVDEWRSVQGLPPIGGDEGKARLVPLNSYLAVDALDMASRPQAAAGGRPPSEPPADQQQPEDAA